MKTPKLIIGLLSVAVLAASCKKEGCTDPVAENYDEDAKKDDESCIYGTQEMDVDLVFSPKFDGQSLALMQNYEDDSSNTIHFTRLDFYVSSVDLIGENSAGIHSSSDVFLFTMNDKTFSINGIESEDATLKTVTFNVGVPENLNTSNGADAKDPSEYPSGHPLAFHTPSMHWSWNSGYIFIAMEGKADTDNDGNVDTDFEYHIGMNSMLSDVSVSADQLLTGGSNTVSINVDVDQIIAGVNCATELITHTMDNMPLANKIKSNIPNSFSIN